MMAHLSPVHVTRIRRTGIRPLSFEQGLSLLDAALRRPEAALVPVRFDFAMLGARPDALPSLLRALVRARSARPVAATIADASSLAQRLQSLSPADRERTLLELVRAHAAATLGVASPDSLEPNRPFGELGLDSLMALQLRNRLAAATGLRLQATLLFDHPTASAIAHWLEMKLGSVAPKWHPILSEIEQIDHLITNITAAHDRELIDARLRSFFSKWKQTTIQSELTVASADDETLFKLADQLTLGEPYHGN
jgi:acyl carrier protein